MSELEVIRIFTILWGAGGILIWSNATSDFTELFAYLSIISPWTLVIWYFSSSDLTWISPVSGAAMGIVSLVFGYITLKRTEGLRK